MFFIILVSLLSGFFLGFISGRRKGIGEGQELGMLYAPLNIRSISLQKGRCQICETSIDCDKSTSMIE